MSEVAEIARLARELDCSPAEIERALANLIARGLVRAHLANDRREG